MGSIPPITKIEDGLYLGDSVSSRRSEILREHNIAAVVSVSHGRWVHWIQPWYREIILNGQHIFIPANDSMTQDLLPHLTYVCDFIHEHRSRGLSVLVHSDKGVSRSATVMVAYLMRARNLSLEKSLTLVKEKRKIKPNNNFMEQLEVWDARRYNIWIDSVEAIPTPKTEYSAFLSKRAERLQEAALTGDEPVGISSL